MVMLRHMLIAALTWTRLSGDVLRSISGSGLAAAGLRYTRPVRRKPLLDRRGGLAVSPVPSEPNARTVRITR